MSAIASMPLPAQRLALVADDETAIQDICKAIADGVASEPQ